MIIDLKKHQYSEYDWQLKFAWKPIRFTDASTGKEYWVWLSFYVKRMVNDPYRYAFEYALPTWYY